jgi:hypothetical protein
VIVPVEIIVPPVNPSPAVSEVIPPPGADGAHDAETAKLDVVANEADVATLLVPNNEPVIDGANNLEAVTDPTKLVVPETINPLPVTNNDPVTSNPFGKLIYPVNDDAVAAVVANDDDTALLAQLAVPNVEPLWTPINEPVNEPVLI